MNPVPKTTSTTKRLYFIGLTGTPGAGKSTFCLALRDLMKKYGRKVKVVNMDPAAYDNLAYEPDWNITELINVQEIMVGENLGFNGAIIKAWDLIEEYLDGITKELTAFEEYTFVILDFCGQVELFTTYSQVRNLYKKLDQLGHQVCNMYVLDSKICLDEPLLIAYSANVQMSMLNLEVPHLNLLTKVDLLFNAKNKDKLPVPFFNYSCLDEESTDIILSSDKDKGTKAEEDPFEKKYDKLTRSLAQLLHYIPTVSYRPCTVKDERFLKLILCDIDRCLHYIQKPEEESSSAYGRLVMYESNEERELRAEIDVYLEKCVKKDKDRDKPVISD